MNNYYCNESENYGLAKCSGNDELMHYGVLGMRWGVRRAQNKLAKAKQLRSKGQTAKAQRLEAKAKKSLAKHERYSGGKKVVNYTKNESLGKTLVKSYLMGTYGALKYNEARAKGADRGKAAVDAVLISNMNTSLGGLMSVVEPRLRKIENN